MAKMEMKAATEAAAEVIEEVSATPVTDGTVAVRPPMAPATYTQDDDAEGEFDATDIEKAKLTVVAKTGKLSNIFTPGDLLLNGEYVIGNTKTPLEVTVVGIKKLYQNDLDFDGGEMGETVSKAREVLEKGGVVGYRPFDDKEATHYWKKVLQVLLLIKKPDGLSPDAASLFPFEIDGSDYVAAGFWASSKTAFRGVAEPLIRAKQKSNTVRLVSYKLSTKGEATPDNKRSWIQATLRAIGPVSPGMTKFLSENYGG